MPKILILRDYRHVLSLPVWRDCFAMPTMFFRLPQLCKRYTRTRLASASSANSFSVSSQPMQASVMLCP